MFNPAYHCVTTAAITALAAAMLPCGAAAADPNQDDQFLAVLQEKQIPAMENISTVVAAGHTVCRKLDDGIPAHTVLDGLDNDAFGMNPALREQSDRLAATMSRFIAAAVEVYCPGDQGKIASLAAARTSTAPAGRFVAAHHRLRTGTGGAVLGSPADTIATGDASQPKPPKIPPPKAPKAKIPRSPGTATKPPPQQKPPPPPKQPPPPQAPPEQLPPPPPPEQILPPPPQQPPPPPQNLPAPGGPPSGSATDSSGSENGGGDNGGAGGGGSDNGTPAEPPPAQPRAPGMIQLVPW